MPNQHAASTMAAPSSDHGHHLVAWAYAFAAALIAPLVLLQLGFTTTGTIHQEWSSYPADLFPNRRRS